MLPRPFHLKKHEKTRHQRMVMPGLQRDNQAIPGDHPFSLTEKTALFDGIHGNSLPILAKILKLDGTVNLGKKGVITATADIGAGMNHRTQLPNQNIAGPDDLATEPFDSAPLTGAIAAIS
jgi:hypothetical protein